MGVLSKTEFCGDKGDRTIFIIVNADAVSIKKHSGMKGEDEFIMMPGTKIKVDAIFPAGGSLTHMQCTYVKNMLNLKDPPI